MRFLRSSGVARRVFIVGAIPVVVAMSIAVAAWALLIEAERARDGAVLSSETFRTFTLLNTARDDVGRRDEAQGDAPLHFAALADKAEAQLAQLGRVARTEEQAARVATVQRDLAAQVEQMHRLARLSGDLGIAAAGMARRADLLVAQTDAERRRQQDENAHLVADLTARDAALEVNQRVVSALRDVREAISAVELDKTRIGRPVFQVEFDELASDIELLDRTGTQLHAVLAGAARRVEAGQFATLLRSYRNRSQSGDAGLSRVIAEGFELTRATQSGHALIAWCDRLIRESVEAQNRLQAEVAGLIRHAVSSNEAELTTQGIALAALRLAQQSASALDRRKAAAAEAVVTEGADLAARAQGLVLPPGVQGELTTAIAGWRAQLAATVDKIREQEALVAEMNRRDAVIGANAQALNRTFIDDADRVGTSIRRLLLAGAAGALLLGTAAVAAVARSITRPLRLLTGNVLRATTDPGVASVGLGARRDELGDIARASDTFLAELRRREAGWREAARRADAALVTLRQTQDDLVRSEKLASLGQLVAGVSHEISTPLGIALTTSTQVQGEASAFEALVAENRLSRSRLVQHAARMRDGARIMTTNLMRASDLLYSFKQVASDQVFEERRVLDLRSWIDELLTSLRALARPGRHEILAECPDGLSLDTYPGILAQVLTNAVKNAIDHGTREGHLLRVVITARPEPMRVVVTIGDDGAGIEPKHLDRVFDPFFTTARARGGTGLGLHIIHNLVTHRLNGSVEIQSTVGQGTCVRLQLPQQIG